MKKITISLLLIFTLSFGVAFAKNDVTPNCRYKGIPLYGKVRIVKSFGDLKVKYVETFPDLKVQYMTNFPAQCGEWQIVDNFEDFTIEIVEHFADIKVKKVKTFPGLE